METYVVQSSDHVFSIWQKHDHIHYEGVDEPFLIHFFRLDEDLDSLLKEIDRDPIIHRAIEKYRGMRLIRQDPWECLLSFLCSSAKAIPQIRCIIESLCRSSGRKVPFENYIGYGFPEPQWIKPSPQLESIQAGFRTRFLIEASRCIDRRQLVELRRLPYQDAKQQLMKLSGVGRKVADCILLYSLDFLEAFPVDTWVKKGLQENYFNGRRIGEKAMEEFVSKHFGPYAGYAQLYLYHFWRHNPFQLRS
jgi:N-glycosylase/DNA lyase